MSPHWYKEIKEWIEIWCRMRFLTQFQSISWEIGMTKGKGNFPRERPGRHGLNQATTWPAPERGQVTPWPPCVVLAWRRLTWIWSRRNKINPNWGTLQNSRFVPFKSITAVWKSQKTEARFWIEGDRGEEKTKRNILNRILLQNGRCTDNRGNVIGVWGLDGSNSNKWTFWVPLISMVILRFCRMSLFVRMAHASIWGRWVSWQCTPSNSSGKAAFVLCFHFSRSLNYFKKKKKLIPKLIVRMLC